MKLKPLLFAVAVLASLFSLFACSSGVPAIGDVLVATNLDESSKPVQTTASYQPSDTFYISVRVIDMVVGSEVNIQYKLDGELYEESTLAAHEAGTGQFGFSLMPPEAGHMPGSYVVEAYLDGKLAKTVTFTVEGDVLPQIVDAVLAKSLDADNKPVDPTDIFAPTDVIYLSVKGIHLKPGMEVKVVYAYSDGQTQESVHTVENNRSGYLAFSLSPSEKGHLIGNYSLDIYLDGEIYDQTLRFIVR